MNIIRKILFFTSFPPPNTGQTLSSKLIFSVLKDKFDLDFINTSSKQGLNRNIGKFSFIYSFTILFKYFHLFFKINFNFFNILYTVYSPSKFGLFKDVLLVFIAKFLNFRKVKIISHVHSGNYGLHFKTGVFKYLFGFVLKNTDLIILLSPRLNHISVDYPFVNIKYLTNMIDDQIICTDNEVKSKIISKSSDFSEFNIVYISNMIPEKGYLDLAKAIKLINNNRIKINVHYIGDWKNVVERKKFLDSVKDTVSISNEIHGPIYDRDRLKQMFLKADVFVLPTYYPIEAQPLSIIEAFCSGTPVISTIHASIPDMVQNNINGFLVNINSPLEISNCINKLFDKDLSISMSNSARKTYLLNYSKEIIIPQIIKIFEN